MLDKNKKRKSLIVLISFTFWVGYVGLTAVQYYKSAAEAADVLIGGRKSSLDFVVSTSTTALVNDNINLLESQMKKSRELFMIDFYILQKGGKVVSFYNHQNDPAALNVTYTQFNRLLETDKLAFRSIKIFDYTLTVGIITNRNGVILNILKLDYLMILKDIASVTFLLVILLGLYLKDIINLSKVLSQRNRDPLGSIHSMSKEGATLLRAAVGFENSQENLKKENLHFSNTITPAIMHEIQSQKNPPYNFQSTMVRVDLNGYTQIFLEKKDEYISEVMNKYFVQAREIIERYHGLIYQYVGDEIVFHIKNDHPHSAALAVACIRSLFEVADSVEKSLPADAEHYFKIKSCLAQGKMRFVHLDTGYGLSGLPLIETARLLTQIEDKTKNSVCFYEELHPEFSFLCEIDERKDALFKGFQNQTHIARTSSFKDIHHFIHKGDFARLIYFRSDSDLSAICKFFQKNLSMENEGHLFTVFSYLKNLRFKTISPEMLENFTGLFEAAAQRNRERWLSDKAFSTVIALITPLIPAHQTNDRILSLLNECLDHPDHRTCANAILVLGDLSKDASFLREFIHSENNRVSADAMLVAGKRALDKELSEKIVSYIKSRNPLFQASGLYVAKELVSHFRRVDPIYFETNEHLQSLKDLIPPPKKHAA